MFELYLALYFTGSISTIICQYACNEATVHDKLLYCIWNMNTLEIFDWLRCFRRQSHLFLKEVIFVEACRLGRKGLITFLAEDTLYYYLGSGFYAACCANQIGICRKILMMGKLHPAFAIFWALKSQSEDVVLLCLRHLPLNKISSRTWAEIWTTAKSEFAKEYLNIIHAWKPFNKQYYASRFDCLEC